MGRDTEFPLSGELEENLTHLLAAVNLFRNTYGKPMVVSSGYRPGSYNTRAGGAAKSAHVTCEAVDFRDRDGSLAEYCLSNLPLLEKCGLYLENPVYTVGWVHLQTRAPKSGSRVFNP